MFRLRGYFISFLRYSLVFIPRFDLRISTPSVRKMRTLVVGAPILWWGLPPERQIWTDWKALDRAGVQLRARKAFWERLRQAASEGGERDGCNHGK